MEAAVSAERHRRVGVDAGVDQVLHAGAAEVVNDSALEADGLAGGRPRFRKSPIGISPLT
jgi:hypothetical protein